MAWLVSCFLHQLCIQVFQAGWAVFYHVVYLSVHVYPVYGIISNQTHHLNSHVVVVQLAQYLLLPLRRYYYSFAFYEHIIYHGQFMSDGPIFLYVLCHVISFLFGQPCMIYALRSFRCASWAFGSCLSYMHMHTGISGVVLIVLTFMLWPGIYLCSLCGCGEITNMQYTAWGLAYIVCIPCTDIYIELFAAGIVIALPHPYQLLLPMVCGVWWHVLHMQSNSG